MECVRKTYVQFLFPNIFSSDTNTKEISHRDPSRIRVARGVYAFTFFDVFVAVVENGREKVELRSEAINLSPVYYCGGKLYTRAQVRRAFPKKDILLSNLRGLRLGTVVRTRFGQFFPFEKGDVLLAQRAR